MEEAIANPQTLRGLFIKPEGIFDLMTNTERKASKTQDISLEWFLLSESLPLPKKLVFVYSTQFGVVVCKKNEHDDGFVAPGLGVLSPYRIKAWAYLSSFYQELSFNWKIPPYGTYNFDEYVTYPDYEKLGEVELQAHLFSLQSSFEPWRSLILLLQAENNEHALGLALETANSYLNEIASLQKKILQAQRLTLGLPPEMPD